MDMVNKYYDLATSFYEYGWGESFHFAHRLKGESLEASIKRHEHYVASCGGFKENDKVCILTFHSFEIICYIALRVCDRQLLYEQLTVDP
jgi:hypothetical protein